jgi:putative spermidine/putrescine transport system ATP-binding protein
VKEFNKLIINEVNKSFGSLEVLKNFNLVIEKGEFVTFLGPSGCGKSTALNCISGLLQISGGEIYIDDECLDNSDNIFVPPEKRGFGIVFQNYALFPHLTVFKNVAFGLEIAKVPKEEIKKRVMDALRMVRLEDSTEKYPSQLSGGQQQRVAIARCAVMEPRLLLLDEPLSNLDAKLRIEMRYELKLIHRRLGISSIYVTHDQQEALALSDRIVVMKIGEVQQIGTPEEIFKYPANKFVADFMGFKNMWPAKIEKLETKGTIWEVFVDIAGNKFRSVRDISVSNDENSKQIIEAHKNNQKVICAVRPEDLRIGEADENTLDCRISVTEYLGTVCQVNAVFNNDIQVSARHALKPNQGDMITYSIPPEKIVLFPQDKEDEK